MPFGQHQDTELWNNQFPETKILGLAASRRMRDLVYMASRDEVDVDTFHKGIQYALEKLGKSKLAFESTTVSNLKRKRHEALGTSLLIIPELRVLVLTKRHVGCGNEIDNYLKIMVCSCVVPSKRVLLQIIFYSSVIGTTFSRQKWKIASLSCQEMIKICKQSW